MVSAAAKLISPSSMPSLTSEPPPLAAFIIAAVLLPAKAAMTFLLVSSPSTPMSCSAAELSSDSFSGIAKPPLMSFPAIGIASSIDRPREVSCLSSCGSGTLVGSWRGSATEASARPLPQLVPGREAEGADDKAEGEEAGRFWEVAADAAAEGVAAAAARALERRLAALAVAEPALGPAFAPRLGGILG